MSCLDVMYHQSYGSHYLPATPAAAAAAYKAAYYHHHHHHQQQQVGLYERLVLWAGVEKDFTTFNSYSANTVDQEASIF